jgi:CHAD domain-containing protein
LPARPIRISAVIAKRATMANSICSMAAADTIQEIAGEQAQKLLRRLTFEINRVVRSCEPDRVHDLRVVIRRFVQVLRAFKPSFSGKEIRRMRRRLKRFLAAAGDVRNCDVVLELLLKSPGSAPDDLLMQLEAERKERKRALLTELGPWAQAKTSLKWRAALLTAVARTHPSFGAKRIGEVAQGILPRMAKNVFDQGRRVVGAKSVGDLHDLRIATKKLRYTLELFAPFSGQSLNSLQENLKLVQARLGDINDCETLREIVKGHRGLERFEAWLKKRQQRKTQEFRRHWEKHFGDRPAQQVWIDCLRRLAPEPQPPKKSVASSGRVSAASRSQAAAVA